MTLALNYIRSEFADKFKDKRPNEQHIADVINYPDEQLSLQENIIRAKNKGVQYVILGIPEDIGPRANCGKGGADKGWRNFLNVFLNQQANQYFDWSECLLLGDVDVADLQAQSVQVSCSDHKLASLRVLCQKLDDRVSEVLTPIFSSQLEVIVIGGGHNNAYPIIRSLYQAEQQGVACVNLDPHADFRAMEGRHSGNPFRYAYQEDMLSHYCVVGLHEQKNNQEALEALHQAQFPIYPFQSMTLSQNMSFEDMLFEAREYVSETSGPIGVELDLDCIQGATASAYSVTGFSIEQAARYVYRLATLRSTRYVHLCEGAPVQHEHSVAQSFDIGQTLTQLVYAYVKARTDKEPELPI